MSALPYSESGVQSAVREAHEHLQLYPYDRAAAYRRYNEAHAVDVARWYVEEAELAADRPPCSEATRVYRELSSVIAYQFYYLTKKVGILIDFTVADPYTSSQDMFDRFFSTGVLTVFKTPPGHHPVMSEEDHDKFRAVHDLLGHCAWLNSFGPKGEDAAYLSHAATMPLDVLPAMCAETRVQNAMYNYAQLIDGRERHQYARQSWLLSPPWVWRHNL